MINERALLKGCVPALLNQPVLSKTIMSSFESKRIVRMNKRILPEFDRNKRIDSPPPLVFSGPSWYDEMLGQDFLCKIGMELDFKKNSMKWMDSTVLMKNITFWNEANTMNEVVMSNDKLDNTSHFYATQILDAKYE
jgi:hypothetical protein